MELALEDYEHVMLDLETLGTRPGDAIISIGAVMFDIKTKTIGPMFRANLDIEQVIASGFGVTGGTLKFWFGQSDEARKQALENSMNMHAALMGLAEALTNYEGGVNKNMKVWGNGAACHSTHWLLREMYERLGLETPWAFWNDRCFRTLKNEYDPKKEFEPVFEGERHNALTDALHQAKWLINMKCGERYFSDDTVLPDDEPESDQMELDLNSTPQGEYVGGGEEQENK